MNYVILSHQNSELSSKSEEVLINRLFPTSQLNEMGAGSTHCGELQDCRDYKRIAKHFQGTERIPTWQNVKKFKNGIEQGVFFFNFIYKTGFHEKLHVKAHPVPFFKQCGMGAVL